jgi:hypothetical protein
MPLLFAGGICCADAGLLAGAGEVAGVKARVAVGAAVLVIGAVAVLLVEAVAPAAVLPAAAVVFAAVPAAAVLSVAAFVVVSLWSVVVCCAAATRTQRLPATSSNVTNRLNKRGLRDDFISERSFHPQQLWSFAGTQPGVLQGGE